MNLLFDLDGTLTDPYQGITKCIVHALTALGTPAPPREELRWCIGPSLRNSFATLLGSDDVDLVEKALSIYRERFGSVGLFENEVYDGIPDALASLQTAGHTLYVATSKPGVYAARIVDHFDLGRFFKKVYGCELDGTRGDKESLISYILQKESIDPAEATMIGDRKYDIDGAKANGVRAFGVLWGYGSQSELKGAGPQDFIHHPQALATVFNSKHTSQECVE